MFLRVAAHIDPIIHTWCDEKVHAAVAVLQCAITFSTQRSFDAVVHITAPVEPQALTTANSCQ